MTDKKKKTYCVIIPIAGSITIDVEADDEDGARDAAWEKISEEGEKAGDVTWEYFDKLTSGNVLYAPINEVEVDEV